MRSNAMRSPADWPAPGATRAAQLLRWLVLVKCLGRPRADAAFHDPALRDLFGIAPQIGWPETAAWLGALGQARRRDLARAFRHGAPRGAGAAADLDYLALPRTTGIDPIWQRALTFGAQRVMRGFAARLPGFGRSRYALPPSQLSRFRRDVGLRARAHRRAAGPAAAASHAGSDRGEPRIDAVRLARCAPAGALRRGLSGWFRDLSDQFDLPLTRLDRLLEREIVRLRARYQLSLDEFRGLYVSDEQVDRLVRAAATEADSELFAAPTAAGGLFASVADRPSRWAELAARFALQPLDLDLILLALAPEIDLKYETLYAYLNNDVTRKWPTLDLAQRLLGHDPPSRASIAAALSPAGRLAEAGILERVEPPAARPSLLNAGFALTRDGDPVPVWACRSPIRA